jgi:hypothetical protein
MCSRLKRREVLLQDEITATPPDPIELLDRDRLVDLADVNPLPAPVSTEPKVYRGCQSIHDDHEKH